MQEVLPASHTHRVSLDEVNAHRMKHGSGFGDSLLKHAIERLSVMTHAKGSTTCGVLQSVVCAQVSWFPG